jgi:hypothetical protein
LGNEIPGNTDAPSREQPARVSIVVLSAEIYINPEALAPRDATPPRGLSKILGAPTLSARPRPGLPSARVRIIVRLALRACLGEGRKNREERTMWKVGDVEPVRVMGAEGSAGQKTDVG